MDIQLVHQPKLIGGVTSMVLEGCPRWWPISHTGHNQDMGTISHQAAHSETWPRGAVPLSAPPADRYHPHAGRHRMGSVDGRAGPESLQMLAPAARNFTAATRNRRLSRRRGKRRPEIWQDVIRMPRIPCGGGPHHPASPSREVPRGVKDAPELGREPAIVSYTIHISAGRRRRHKHSGNGHSR